MNNILKGKLKEIYFDSLNLVKKHNFDFLENINLNFSISQVPMMQEEITFLEYNYFSKMA